MVMSGVVLVVESVTAGASVEVDAGVGATEVQLVDAIDLPLAGGSVLLPDGSVVAFTSADHDLDVVSFTEPLPTALVDGDRVTLVPVSSFTQATVRLDEDGGAVPVRVPHAMQPNLPVGVRESGMGERVTVEVREDGSFWVGDVHDRPPLEVWGDPDGAAMEMRPEGLSAYAVGPQGRYEATRLGSGDDRLGVFNAEGQVVGGVSADGGLVGQSGVVAGDLSVGGVPLLGRLWDNSPGQPVGWLERFAAGDVGSRLFDLPSGQVPTNQEYGYAKVGFSARAGRSYMVRVTGQITPHALDAGIRVRIRYATGGTEPTITSPELAFATTGSMYSPTVRQSAAVAGRISAPSDTDVRVLFTFQGLGGATPEVEEALFEVQDIGPQGVYGGGTYTTGREATPPPTVREYTSTWTASGFRVYDETQQPVTDAPQPAQFGFVGGAHTYTAIAFTGTGTGDGAGQTVTDFTTGGTITKAEVFLANTSNGGNDQGRVYLGNGNVTDLPPTLAPQATVTPTIPTGAGAWTEVPASWFTGSNRVVTLGDADGGVNAAWFMGPADDLPPAIRLTVTK